MERIDGITAGYEVYKRKLSLKLYARELYCITYKRKLKVKYIKLQSNGMIMKESIANLSLKLYV